jgi:hypothetical protein
MGKTLSFKLAAQINKVEGNNNANARNVHMRASPGNYRLLPYCTGNTSVDGKARNAGSYFQG